MNRPICRAKIIVLSVLILLLWSVASEAQTNKHRATVIDEAGNILQGGVRSVEIVDSLALVALYLSGNGHLWEDNSGWLVDPVEFWVGVQRVENVGTAEAPEWRVTRFVMPERNMQNSLGTIPPEIGNMTAITVFSVNRNLFTGVIPDEISNLRLLDRFDVENNRMYGEVPWDALAQTRIRVLRLMNNNFTGQIPGSIGEYRFLEVLTITNNNFTGPLPAELNNIRTLRQIRSTVASISGDIPDLSNLTDLFYLELGGNFTPGPIPDFIRNLSNMERLRFTGSNRTGDVPLWLGELTQLRELRFANERISGEIPELIFLSNLQDLAIWNTPITGNFPEWVAFLPNIRQIDIVGAPITGTIPPQLGSATGITQLNIARTRLTGTIPSDLQNITNLRRLGIYENPNLEVPEIPDWIRNLPSLERLDMYSQGVTGQIPSWLGNVPFTRLSIHNNALTGSIPTSFSNLNRLEYLNISGNQITGGFDNLRGLPLSWLNVSDNPFNLGSLPIWMFDADRLEVFSAANIGLTSTIPTWLGSMRRLTLLNLADNSMAGRIPAQLANRANDNVYIFTSLNLSGNNLTGEIPQWITSFNNLVTLEIGRNNFDSGPIPEFIVQLDSLTTLGLGGTNRTGSIPDWIGSFRNLTSIALDDNQLTGSLPASLGSVIPMDSLNLAGNQLTGSIPEEWSTMGIGMPGSNRTTMTALVLSDNSGLSGPLPSFFTSWQTHSFRNYIFETDVIRVFKVDGTNLCELDDSGFDDWFNKILAHPGVGFLGVPGVDAYVEVKRSGISCSDVSIDDTFDRAYRFVLHHNFPNPFNPVTTILFEIAQTDHVELAVYSVLGQRVALLINETMPAGKHQIQFNAVNLSSGLYIYRLQSANYSATRFMTLIK